MVIFVRHHLTYLMHSYYSGLSLITAYYYVKLPLFQSLDYLVI